MNVKYVYTLLLNMLDVVNVSRIGTIHFRKQCNVIYNRKWGLQVLFPGRYMTYTNLARFCDRFKYRRIRWPTWLTRWRLNKMKWTHFEQWEIQKATLLLKRQFTLVHRGVHERWLLFKKNKVFQARDVYGFDILVSVSILTDIIHMQLPYV